MKERTNDCVNEAVKLENLVSFPLYAASKETVKLYRSQLEALNLTYTQYIAMLAFWERKRMNVKELGERLYLDSGTLTPVLKSLEAKGFVRRYRSMEDERVLLVELTEAGEELRKDALKVPPALAARLDFSPEDTMKLHELLYRLLTAIRG